MSGKMSKSRNVVNSAESATLSVNEKILRECHSLYTDAENGLVKIAANIGLHLLAPRKKITVLLIGNHSAGKSSFINWYIEEHVQKTGVAIETQGFSFVTSGRKRESLTGNATLHLYPHFEPLRDIKGITDYLTTEISTSKQKRFSLVTFVDTPGLVDGDMKYPFDVNRSIMWLGDLADLIFVFFDPIGQALCKRTLNLVECLNEKHAERMRFYLSKADEAGHEADRQRVMMQIVQELCKRPGLNRTGFDMPTIYIPNPNKPSRCVNQIDEVAKDVERTINQTVQNTLNALEKDCEKISDIIHDKLITDSESVAKNFKLKSRGFCLCLLGVFIPVIFALSYVIFTISDDLLHDMLGRDTTDVLKYYMNLVNMIWKIIPQSSHQFVWIGIGVVAVLFLLLAKYSTRSRETLGRRKRKQLSENADFVKSYIQGKKQTLYKKYLEQSVTEQEM